MPDKGERPAGHGSGPQTRAIALVAICRGLTEFKRLVG